MSNCDCTEWCAHTGAAKARPHNKAVKRVILPPYVALFSDRARPHLELYNLRPCALAPFLVPRRVHRVARPESATLPAGFRVVDSSGRVTSGESQRVRYAQGQRLHLAVLRYPGEEGIRVDVASHQDILPETEGVVVIDVG